MPSFRFQSNAIFELSPTSFLLCVSLSLAHKTFFLVQEIIFFPHVRNLKHLKRFFSKFIFKRNNESQHWQRKQCEKLQLRKSRNIMGICRGGLKWKSLQPALAGICMQYSIRLWLLQHRVVLLFGQLNTLYRAMRITCWQSSRWLRSSIFKSTAKAEHLYICRFNREGCAVSFWAVNSYKRLGFLHSSIIKSAAFWTTPSGLAESSTIL